MSVTRPRGPLPARVYWFRRLLVLAVASAVVLGLAHLLGGGAGESDAPVARPASGVAVGSPSGSPSALSTADAAAQQAGQQSAQQDARPGRRRTRAPLATPTGPCRDSDVRVVPSLEQEAYAGEKVTLTLRLSTGESPACSWEVSADTVVVKLTSGSDRIWTTQDCPAVVPTEPVVLRNNRIAKVDVVWSGRRSDAECSRTTPWAQPGWYHVAAAAMGSDPDDEQFELREPAPITITPTPTPTPKEKPGRDRADG